MFPALFRLLAAPGALPGWKIGDRADYSVQKQYQEADHEQPAAQVGDPAVLELLGDKADGELQDCSGKSEQADPGYFLMWRITPNAKS